MAYIGMAYIAMAYIAMAYIVMAYIVMAYIVMAYIAMAYIVMAYIAMAYIVMTYIVMAYIAMVYIVMAYIAMTALVPWTFLGVAATAMKCARASHGSAVSNQKWFFSIRPWDDFGVGADDIFRCRAVRLDPRHRAAQARRRRR